MRSVILHIALLLGLCAGMAHAGHGPPREDAPRDTLTVGIGAALIPRYEGSGDYAVSPAAAIRGSVGGVQFMTMGTALLVDVVPQTDRAAPKLILGPVAQLRLSRSGPSRIRDPQVRALGKVGVTAELGGQIGVGKTGLITSAYDTASASVAVTHDVGGVHKATIITPSLSYGTPLSRKVYVGVFASATHVGRGYAQRYFGVTAAQATASGLSVYTARSGWKDAGGGALATFALSGDLRRGASIFALGNYSRLQGHFARAPVVRARNQWFAALGVGYTF